MLLLYTILRTKDTSWLRLPGWKPFATAQLSLSCTLYYFFLFNIWKQNLMFWLSIPYHFTLPLYPIPPFLHLHIFPSSSGNALAQRFPFAFFLYKGCILCSSFPSIYVEQYSNPSCAVLCLLRSIKNLLITVLSIFSCFQPYSLIPFFHFHTFDSRQSRLLLKASLFKLLTFHKAF